VRPRLLHPDREFDTHGRLPRQAATLVQDLELSTLTAAMARGDKRIADIAQRALLAPLTDLDAIAYRQAVVRDCLAHPNDARALYALAVAAIERAEQASWAFMPRKPASIVRHARDVLLAYLESLRALRRLADRRGEHVASDALRVFFELIRRELDDAALREMERHLRALRFTAGIRVSAGLGPANKARDIVLHHGRARARVWTRLERWWPPLRRRREPAFSYQLDPADENGVRALDEVRDRILEGVSVTLAQASEQVAGFFHALRSEMAFYVGCLNLAERLGELGAATCLPEPVADAPGPWQAQGLYDPCLALSADQPPVDNDVAPQAASLVIVTGANQGGKTTFLRSVGLAQLMLQAGMVVAARSLRAGACAGIFTHFKREEDASMTSGKLDEELARMSAIVDELRPGSLLLLNESFAATNEREGSEIAHQIVDAVTESGVRVYFVTHLDDFARRRYERDAAGTLFLRAERRPDGERTFKLRPGAPERTSHGMDLYRAIFGDADDGVGDAEDEAAGPTADAHPPHTPT